MHKGKPCPSCRPLAHLPSAKAVSQTGCQDAASDMETHGRREVSEEREEQQRKRGGCNAVSAEVAGRPSRPEGAPEPRCSWSGGQEEAL